LTRIDGFDLLFFEEQVAPDTVFDIEPAAGNGDVDSNRLPREISIYSTKPLWERKCLV
jgi:hypothetical protein